MEINIWLYIDGVQKQLNMQRAINRFWDWLFHPSIRAYTNPNSKASIYRYPSPGNTTEDPLITNVHTDYKTPYEHTHLNVRYLKPTPAQTRDKEYETLVAPLVVDPLTKLKKAGLLKRGEQNNVDAVAAAKAKFKQIYGFAVEQRVYRNDTEENFLNSTKREDISAYIQSYYQNLRNAKYDETDYALDKSVINDPQTVPLQSVDMFVLSHMQQGRIANEYLLQHEINENLKKKRMDAVVGDAKFWKAIDDSFDTKEVAKVQTQLGDPEPTNFSMKSHSKVQIKLDSNGKVVDLNPQH